MSGQYHVPATLPPVENPGTHLGGWVGPKSGGSNGFGNRESKAWAVPLKSLSVPYDLYCLWFPSSCLFFFFNTCSGLLKPRSVCFSVVPLGWTPNCPTKCKSCRHHKAMHNNKNVHVGRTSRLANNTCHLQTCIVLSKSVKHTNMVCLVNHKISDMNQTHLLAPSAVQSSGYIRVPFSPRSKPVTTISFPMDSSKFIEHFQV